jgi:ABC-2 type transport system ATP-binding protein
MAQIELQGISKEFGILERPVGKWSTLRGAFIRNARIIKALEDISFQIAQGELVGYIGPNGAGCG